MSWELLWNAEETLLHVLPVDDIYEHEPGSCICGTRVEAVVGAGRTVAGWIVIHQSLDGREFDEYDYQGEPMPVEPETDEPRG